MTSGKFIGRCGLNGYTREVVRDCVPAISKPYAHRARYAYKALWRIREK